MLYKYLFWLQEKLLSYPKLLILLVCVACGFSLNYTINNLGFNTDTTGILSSELPFQLDRKRLLQLFPQDDQAILIVIDAEAPELTSRALSDLGDRLKAENEYVQSVYIPGEGAFFERQGLTFLELADLEALAANLAQAQPFIGRLYQDSSLNGFLSTISLALTHVDHELPIDLKPMLAKITAAIMAVNKGNDFQLSWQQLMFGGEPDLLTTQRFILVKPNMDFGELLPAEKSLRAIRTITEKTKALFPRVSIRITGEVALEHDELASVAQSTIIASLVSLILVCTALLIGLRSLTMMFATLLSLVVGLIFTATFAASTIGHLNLISVAFSVLYIGLGVDYAIHLCLRYRELLQQNYTKEQALSQSTRAIAPSLALCALTTSAAFYAFVPTAYAGVSELGIIAGTGMFIALIISLIVLPAILKILPVQSKGPQIQGTLFPDCFYRFPMTNSKTIRLSAMLLSLIALGLLTQVKFDFNPVNLRDPDSESVSTFKELLKNKITSPLTLTVIAEDKENALAKAEKLETLDSVENAITVFDFIPDEQEEKLEIIDDIGIMLGLQAGAFPPLQQDTVDNNNIALESFLEAIDKSLEHRPDNALNLALEQLRHEVQQLLITLDSAPARQQEELLVRLQSSLLGFLPDTMNSLLKGGNANRVTVDDLPKDLFQRWVSQEGAYRVMAFPRKDLNDIDNLREFVAEVKAVEASATDLPVIYLESGKAVVKAFQQALIGALGAIIIILVIVLRSIKDVALVLLPLMMAAGFTGAATVLLKTPFNFAYIIAVPLIFGLGVDSGIHMIHRLRHAQNKGELLLRTSTARAIFFSGLTTLLSFVSLAFTSHLGIASMGQLLAIGIALIVFCTLVVLPAFVKEERQ